MRLKLTRKDEKALRKVMRFYRLTPLEQEVETSLLALGRQLARSLYGEYDDCEAEKIH
jgi:hypothetical protein